MTRFLNALLLIFCSTSLMAQHSSSTICIKIIVKAGVSANFSYPDNDSSYDMNVIRVPKRSKDTLIQKNIFTVNGSKSALSKWVNLNSIPRYIVYDKKKKLVQNDAPRPSDASVLPILNQLLKN